jgi:starch-binding outer membrane protein, SusD/RagB family
MKFYRYIKAFAFAVIITGGFVSCSDMLEVSDRDVLGANEVYRNIDDANAAIRGVYGLLVDLAPQYVVLNELRADLLDVTANASPDLVQLAAHQQLTVESEWANPRKFFELINNCNDVIANLQLMYNNKAISREEFQPRYSDMVAVRSWTYLQLGLHFADPDRGGVPYITSPIRNVDDLNAAKLAQLPHYSLEVLVDTLLKTMEAIPYKKRYTDVDLLRPIDAYNTRVMYIDKEYFLGELHLWNGNYRQAAEYFKTVLERGVSGNDIFDLYKLPFDASATLEYSTSRYNSGYTRFYQNDRLSARNMWPYMFNDIQTSNFFNEWFWVQFYDGQSKLNPFVNIFAKDGGQYLLKPSQLAIDNWNKQVQRNGFEGDFRGNFFNYYGLPGSYQLEDGEPVALKHIYNHTYSALNKTQGRWFLWRAGGLHLRYCEAANRDGQFKVAYALLNSGISSTFVSKYPQATNNYTDSTYRQQTGLPFPYDFDARSTGVNDVPPNLRQPWLRNAGVRGRAYLPNLPIDYDFKAENDADYLVKSVEVMNQLEQAIFDECALELAFEGQRWADLVRLSLRKGKESGDYSFLANQMAKKAEKSGVSIGKDLSVKENWFLPLRIK